jgi:hypothetical protein
MADAVDKAATLGLARAAQIESSRRKTPRSEYVSNKAAARFKRTAATRTQVLRGLSSAA